MASCDEQVALYSSVVDGIKDAAMPLDIAYKEAEVMHFTALPVDVIARGLTSALPLAKTASGQEAITGLQFVRITLRAASEMFRNPEVHDALLRDVMETLFAQVQNADARIRAEAFRCLSVLMHKYAVFAEPYAGQLFQHVTSEVQRYEKTEEVDRSFIASVNALVSLQTCMNNLVTVREKAGLIVCESEDRKSEERNKLLQEIGGKYPESLIDGVFAIIRLQAGDDDVNLPLDKLQMYMLGDDDYDNPDNQTPYMACLDCMAYLSAFATDACKLRVLNHPLLDEKSDDDLVRRYSFHLLAALCGFLSSEGEWLTQSVQRVWKCVITGVVHGKEKNFEIIGNMLWAASGTLDTLIRQEAATGETGEPFFLLMDIVSGNLSDLYEKLIPIAVGESSVSRLKTSASLKAQSVALGLLARLAGYCRTFRAHCGLPPINSTAKAEAPQDDQERERRGQAEKMSQTLVDMHSRLPDNVFTLLESHAFNGADTAYDLVMHAMEVLEFVLFVTPREASKKVAQDLIAWMVPKMNETASYISGLRYNRKVPWVDEAVAWHPALLRPDVFEPELGGMLDTRMKLARGIITFHTLFLAYSRVVSKLYALALEDNAAATATAPEDQMEDIVVHAAAPYARMLTHDGEEVCRAICTALPVYVAYNAPAPTAEFIQATSEAIASIINVTPFTTPPPGLWDGIRSVLNSLAPLMDDTCISHDETSSFHIANVFEAAFSQFPFSEADLQAYYDVCLRNLAVADISTAAVLRNASIVADCVSRHPRLSINNVDKVFAAVNNSVKAMKARMGTARTMAQFLALMRHNDATTYFSTFFPLILTIGSIGVVYTTLQGDEQRSLKRALIACFDTYCDIIKVVGNECIGPVVWQQGLVVGASPEESEAAKDETITALISGCIQAVNCLALAHTRIESIVADEAALVPAMRSIQTLVNYAREMEMMPGFISSMLLESNVQPFHPETSPLHENAYIASLQLLATHLIRMGAMDANLHANVAPVAAEDPGINDPNQQ